jgi:hypothetical protein
MILALVTPHYFPSVRGNSVTVQRIESGLRDEGVGVSVFSLDRQGIRADVRRLRQTGAVMPPGAVSPPFATISSAANTR